jgi:DNA-binding SARP family transcriptional activator
MEYLWPDADRNAALNSLYYALHIARGALDRDIPEKKTGASRLSLVEGVLVLAPTESICIDVEQFQAAAKAARASNDPRAYIQALDLYGGELLPDDRYEDWAARPRELLRATQVDLLFELACLHREQGEYFAAIEALKQLLAQEPTHEEACVNLMQMHASMGQRYRALHQYAQLRKALRDELDVEPDIATQHLYTEICAGKIAA